MVMNVVGDLAQKHAVIDQHTARLAHECRVRMRKAITMLLGRARTKAEAVIKVLLPIPSLVRDMRRIVNHHVKSTVAERHHRVIAAHCRPVFRIEVEANYRPLAAPPEACAVNCRVKDEARFSVWVERKELL